MLEPARILREARRSTQAVLADLEERVRTSLALEEASRGALKDGASEEQVVRRLESLGSYQLHRVRPLAEVLLGLPDDLRRFELTQGMGVRACSSHPWPSGPARNWRCSIGSSST
jgi:hypothetical protein